MTDEATEDLSLNNLWPNVRTKLVVMIITITLLIEILVFPLWGMCRTI